VWPNDLFARPLIVKLNRYLADTLLGRGVFRFGSTMITPTTTANAKAIQGKRKRQNANNWNLQLRAYAS